MRDDGGAPNPRVSPGLNQQELANLLGVHRVTLNKALRALERGAVQHGAVQPSGPGAPSHLPPGRE